jgi:hypothetical protein
MTEVIERDFRLRSISLGDRAFPRVGIKPVGGLKAVPKINASSGSIVVPALSHKRLRTAIRTGVCYANKYALVPVRPAREPLEEHHAPQSFLPQGKVRKNHLADFAVIAILVLWG